MFTTLMLTAVLTCKPVEWAPPPPARTTVACEGADLVRRDARGLELQRWSWAPRCGSRPVRLTADPQPIRFGLTAR